MKLLRIALILPLLASVSLVADPAPEAAPKPAQAPQVPDLPRFDLDFPGGTPSEFVAAIDKASGSHLNLVIPAEMVQARIPPLRMEHVTAPDIMAGLSGAPEQSLFFQLTRGGGGAVSMDTVWTLINPRQGQIGVRFFLLTPYLSNGLTVDDITTAIQTAWKMAGFEDQVKMSYHKETNLLIAVGASPALQVIDGALSELHQGLPKEKKG